ncbi:MAG: esterase [Actinomycetales bacterium]|nr:MAG: esterase [Actinomycetales bacterium]
MSVMPGAEPFSHDGNEVGVVVCHGYTSTPQSMRPWAQHLADQGYSVRLPRLPGMGTRWQDMQRTEWTDWYAAVDAEFETLRDQCEVVFAVGLSMGATLATKLALEHRDLRGIVLVNPMFKHNHPALKILPVLQHIIPTMPGVADDIKKPGVTELAYPVNPLKAMYSQTRMWKVVGEALPQLRTPVLLMRSRVDHVIPPISADYFLSRIASNDVTQIWLEDSFHVATLDNDADRIFKESVTFIERLRH